MFVAAAGRPRHVAEPPYRITALRAMLFYTDSGTFSPDILSYHGPVVLWNVPATGRSEGEIGGPSNATLVVVEIAGPVASSGRQVDFRATSGKKLLLHRTTGVYLNGTGNGYEAFWLYGTGCEPIHLSVRMLGQADSTPRSADLPFRCGE